MYYKNNVVADLEDLLIDFLAYRKNKQMPQINLQSGYEIGKGWPNYKALAMPMPELSMPDNGNEAGNYEAENYIAEDNEAENYIAGMLPKPLTYPEDEQEIEVLKGLYSEINKKLELHVELALRKNEYTGSPIYDDYIDRDCLCRIVEQVLELAADDIKEVGEVIRETDHATWNRAQILRSLVESLVLYSLYWKRKLLGKGKAVKKVMQDVYL